ncbi:unnamed protein product [Vitrella brassicaformis CCMP3155]|uniref:UV radiation resistance-associated gene protein n=2 Tax=Vitrella brassicaformis TaxID=1169539 RepID=A0A0G4EJE5_VITBC|nr:unnamed protein product [Vitrella brassicaformis CCMP3155]|eukprot:CEL96869.1 unnamed protein product [Vitrella brassicaformis CCMP3155]
MCELRKASGGQLFLCACAPLRRGLSRAGSDSPAGHHSTMPTLKPMQRRLRHVQEIAIRNLDPEYMRGFTMELNTPDEIGQIAVSKPFFNTMNPGWDLENQLDSFYRNLREVEVCVSRLEATVTVEGDAAKEDSTTPPRRLKLLFSLMELHPIGHDLSRLPPVPPTTILVKMCDLWHTFRGTLPPQPHPQTPPPPPVQPFPASPDSSPTGLASLGLTNVSFAAATAAAGRAQGNSGDIVGIKEASPREVVNSNAAPKGSKTITTSQICAHGERLGKEITRRRVAINDTQHLLTQINAHLSPKPDEAVSDTTSPSMSSLQQRLKAVQARLQKTRVLLQAKRDELQKGESRLAEEKAQRQKRRERLRRCQRGLQSVKLRLGQSVKDLPSSKTDLRAIQQALYCRRTRMLYELFQVYPIENNGRHRSIRGIPLPSIDVLNRQDLREEEKVATALGFLIHLLLLMAKYVEVPLRMVMVCASSRSFLRDPLSDPPGLEYPLFYRGLDRARFPSALRFLMENLQQFLLSRAHKIASRNNLLENTECLIHREMWGLNVNP